MNAIAHVLNDAAKQAELASPLAPEDYEDTDETLGRVIRCGVCHEVKRYTMMFPDLRDHCKLKPRVNALFCRCARERAEKRRLEETERERERIRSHGGILRDCAFANSERSPEMDKCFQYARKWDEMREKNIGLLLWGGNGPGKTHAAHCVANALIDRDPPVRVYATTFSEILQSGFDKSAVLDDVWASSLVILDDLDAERGSDYAFETIFAIVDERYQARKPLIVTTNLTWEEIKNPKDAQGRPDRRRKRIYDRVVEMCAPIQFHGASRRDAINAEKTEFVRRTLEL